MKFAVVIFPGSNCDEDCVYALETIMGQEVVRVWHKDSDLKGADCVVLPGGFSYGDYLRCGSIARFSPIMQEVIDHANSGGMTIGICNGFQILLEAGLLPGGMVRNRDLKFICRYVDLERTTTNTPFSNFEQPVINIPIAHGEGNYYIDDEGFQDLRDNDQIVFTYRDDLSPDGNPNGSTGNIAGVINKGRNVLGMMPHPERAAEPIMGGSDGVLILKSMIEALG